MASYNTIWSSNKNITLYSIPLHFKVFVTLHFKMDGNKNVLTVKAGSNKRVTFREVTVNKRHGSKKSSREAEGKKKVSELNNNVMKDNSQDQLQRIAKPQTYLMEECSSNRKDIEEALLKDAFETLNLT